MARIRTIKPEFWTDEKVVGLPALARLLFIGMWNFVDEEGRGEFSPIRLKMQILPADAADVSELIGGIQDAGLIEVYEVDGKHYFQVVHFLKHQKADVRYPSKFPPPPTAANSRELPSKEKEYLKEKEKGREKGREKELGATAPEYVFHGAVIKLSKKDYEAWGKANPHVELPSYLLARDAYLAGQPPDEQKRWFISTPADLRNKNLDQRNRSQAPPRMSAAERKGAESKRVYEEMLKEAEERDGQRDNDQPTLRVVSPGAH